MDCLLERGVLYKHNIVEGASGISHSLSCILASHVDVVRGSSRVPVPRRQERVTNS